MFFASLPWYDFPEIRWATDLFWAQLAKNLRARGFFSLPDTLNRTLSYQEQWTSGRLLISQACGYDVLLSHSRYLRMVATPVYNVSGCRGPFYSSLVVVHKNSPAQHLEALRGSRCVINAVTSHSGMNALRAMVAPFHQEGRFFSQVSISGSHEGSVTRIAEGAADVATVDCISYELLRRHRPQCLADIRVLCSSGLVPAPPYVVGAQICDEDSEKIGEALIETVRQPEIAPVKEALLLDGIETVSLASYHPIAAWEREALQLGYAELGAASRVHAA